MDAPVEVSAQWAAVLEQHHNDPVVIARIADHLEAAGVSVQVLSEALENPRRAYAWLIGEADTPAPGWVADPIQRALVCAELSEQDAVSRQRFADHRAAAISEAVERSTVSEVARIIGIRQQVVSRLHRRRRRDAIETAESWIHRTVARPKGMNS